MKILWYIIGPIIRLFVIGFSCVYGYCPHCGYYFDWCEEPFFECINSGFNSDVNGQVYWFVGTQTCPRCDSSWDYGDST